MIFCENEVYKLRPTITILRGKIKDIFSSIIAYGKWVLFYITRRTTSEYGTISLKNTLIAFFIVFVLGIRE